MARKQERTKAFVSYSHKDAEWLEQLRPYLNALAREQSFDIWDDTRIKPGSEWRAEIDSALRAAKVAILLVSQDFLNSEFITSDELPPLLDAATRDGTVVLPLILTPCRFSHHPSLSKFQSVNPPSKTLRQMSVVQRQLLFVKLSERVEELLGSVTDSVLDSAPTAAIERSSTSGSRKVPMNKDRRKSKGRPQVKEPPSVLPDKTSDGKPSGFWQRVAISSASDGSLRYQIRGVREDFIVHPNQRSLIERLVERCVQQTSFEPEMARTLFALLVPAEIRPILFSTGRTELLLDAGSARFPWELLQDSEIHEEPIAVRGSIIRRLSTNEIHMSRSGAGRVLVIGDPESNFPPLHGVQDETRNVAALFGKHGYNVTAQIRDTAENAISALLTEAHQILHLAGNGVVDYSPPDASGSGTESGNRTKFTGFILGDGVFFTCVEAAQMCEAPELVFLNACHLGAISSQDVSELAPTGDRNRFAASLGTQFLRSGAQAVVAPGWAIDDMAAITFANAFYSEMMRGICFGDATRTARKTTFERHPNVNTWGAYHCYGDPDYKLLTTVR